MKVLTGVGSTDAPVAVEEVLNVFVLRCLNAQRKSAETRSDASETQTDPVQILRSEITSDIVLIRRRQCVLATHSHHLHTLYGTKETSLTDSSFCSNVMTSFFPVVKV